MTRRPSPTFLVACLALLVALCGTTVAGYAAGKANGNSLIKKQSLSGNRLKADSVTGSQVQEGSLRKVPSAAVADSAGVAGSAHSAETVPPGALVLLTYGAGWQDALFYSHRPSGFRKDAAGYVHLQGMVVRSSGSAKLIATLPAGSRPLAQSYFAVSSGSATSYVYVSPDGRVNFEAGDPSAVSLDAVAFLAEG